VTATIVTPLAPIEDDDERLLWSIMRRFEVLALERYRATAPSLATDAKIGFVATLDGLDNAAAARGGHALDAATDALLATARGADEATTLVVQGLLLERLGQVIYGMLATTEQPVGDVSRGIARAGRAASESVTVQVPDRLVACLGPGDALWNTFAGASHDVLGALDGLADPVDETFGHRFDLRFADIMGEFTADLVTTCSSMGLPRRKVVAHLAGAAMGL